MKGERVGGVVDQVQHEQVKHKYTATQYVLVQAVQALAMYENSRVNVQKAEKHNGETTNFNNNLHSLQPNVLLLYHILFWIN